MTKLEFFFDLSSPWTYLAFVGAKPWYENVKVDLHWKPILVGGVFNAVNQAVYEHRESMFNNEKRALSYFKDLQNWADYRGIDIGWPTFHPVNSVKAMRGCFVAMESDLLLPYCSAVFEAYWGKQADISNDQVLAQINEQVGIDNNDFFEKISDQSYKDKLRSTTDELIERGGYGSPTFFINETDMYFGNDRLPLIEHRLEQLASP
ncbi:MAG: 2-hydroxychromene-2-carboxylate isomerase [Halioglobus sp.]|jgi:2-hydroxychromene-2-carboxylate isomerase